MRQTTILGHADAQAAIEAVKTEILKHGKAGVIAVADAHGELIALLRMDGAPYTSVVIAANKAYSAARERKPSRQIGQESRDPENGFDMAFFGDPRMIGWGGGLPVIFNDEVIGAVAVSGLPEMMDIEMARFGLDAILKLNG